MHVVYWGEVGEGDNDDHDMLVVLKPYELKDHLPMIQLPVTPARHI